MQYVHVELAEHDLLLAEGLACESFLDTGGRSHFDNGAVTSLHPDFGMHAWEAEGCAPLVVHGPKLTSVRTFLASRIGMTGHERTGPAIAASLRS